MPLKKEQPLFFKKLPVTDTSPANAQFGRYVGVVNGEQVIEINHASQKWLVRESEVLDRDAALAKRAEELNAKIEALKPKHSRKPALLQALGICESTYRRWNQLIQNHLPKKTA